MDLELLRKLVSISAVSGAEDEAIKFVSKEFKKYADNVEIDRMGNVIAKVNGTKEKALNIMVATHLDEIGLIVKYIEPNGFLRVEKVGDLLDYIFPGKEVKIIGEKGLLDGVVSVLPAHLTGTAWGGSERQTSPPVTDQFIDIGVETAEEAKEMGVNVGSTISFNSDLKILGRGKFLAGKALDDRALVAVSIEALKKLRDIEHETTVYFTGTVEEEPGCRGVKVVANRLKPDMVIAMDVVMTGDVPGVEFRKAPIKLGKGPSIKIMDVDLPGTGMFAHRKVKELLRYVANKTKIPVQFDVFGSGLTTDASVVQWLMEGIPSGVLSLPIRYCHGPNEVVHLDDIDNLIKLLVSSIREVKADFDLGRMK